MVGICPLEFDPVPSLSLSLVALRLLDFPLSPSSLSFPLGHPYQPFTPVHYPTTQEFITVVSILPLYIRIFAQHQTLKFQLFERAMLLASFRVARATNKPVDSFQKYK